MNIQTFSFSFSNNAKFEISTFYNYEISNYYFSFRVFTTLSVCKKD